MRETRKIWAHPRYPVILTLGIILTFVIFATVTHEGQPKKLSVAVVDLDGTYLTRRFCHELDATQGVCVKAVFQSHIEARKAMQRGQIFAYYEIPPGTYNKLLQFRAPKMVLYVNSAYMLAGTLSYKQLATMGMLATGAVQREVLRKKGYDETTIMGLIQPVEYDTRTIGNPWIHYGNYLMTTLIPAIIAFVVILHTAFTIAVERRERTMRRWMRKAGGNAVYALLGKMIPYTLWYTLLCLLANLVMFGFMGFPMEGSWLLMVVNTVLLIVASQCAGCMIGGCIPDPPLTMGISTIYSAMSFSLSGFSFPVDSMPGFFQGMSLLYPIRHYFLSYTDIAIFGNGLEHCWSHFCMLLGFGVFMFVGAVMLRWQMGREEQRGLAEEEPEEEPEDVVSEVEMKGVEV